MQVGVDVVAAGQLLQPLADVPHELLGRLLALEVRGGVEVAQVAVDRELHVHVHDPVPGQEEGEVGDGGPALHRALLAVVDALDEPGHPQDVLGRALAPGAPGLGAGQGLPQAARSARPPRGWPGDGLLEAGDQLALLGGAVRRSVATSSRSSRSSVLAACQDLLADRPLARSICSVMAPWRRSSSGARPGLGVDVAGDEVEERGRQQLEDGEGDEPAHDEGTDDGDDHAPMLPRGCDKNREPHRRPCLARGRAIWRREPSSQSWRRLATS